MDLAEHLYPREVPATVSAIDKLVEAEKRHAAAGDGQDRSRVMQRLREGRNMQAVR